MNKTKKSFLMSLTSLLLCVSMLMGTTFAWFTDSVSSNDNVVTAGNLDAEMYWSKTLLDKDSADWKTAKDTAIFTDDVIWEPGHTQVRYVKVENAGSLNFKWKLSIEANGTVTDLAKVIDVYYVDSPATQITSLDGLTSAGKLNSVLDNNTGVSGNLIPGQSAIYAIAFHMDKLAGNDYQKKSLCDGGFSLKLIAAQDIGESDSFGDDYDKEATWPENTVIGNTATATVVLDGEGKLLSDTSLISADGKIKATIPAGTKLQPGLTSTTLNVANMSTSGANITLNSTENSLSLDVHVLGVAEDNTGVIAVDLLGALPASLNIGNYRLYHVEDGNTVEMTLLADGQTPADNTFAYNPATGDVTLYMDSFSEVALVADTVNAWGGNFDYSWYTNATAPVDGEAVTEYQIANADQLAAFGAIVGGMKKVTERVDKKYTYSDEVIQDSFAGKTVKLISDINIGDLNSENGIVFYPIGYYNSEGTYERTNTAITSGLRNFEGTFDGNGHTVENFYHNTWEMKGDHNWYSPEEQYYRDGMGLFGRVYKGTVKNLTVKNFSSDGEITTTGVIAAYADGATFENIAIFNCNPRVYNIGNGGIVGCVGWYAKEANLKTTFTNITVDNSNKISALWGSYDVACGGIVGQYYPTSGQTSANTPPNAGIEFVNCHVSAIMDVYNDVCANYQYYAYRYTGMMIGSIRENETIDGHSYPKMNGITASGCTVHFGDWNDYYYCELVANSLASYTHDHQMSRLTQVEKIDTETKKYLPLGAEDKAENWLDIPTSGRVNYVVVKAKDDKGLWIHGDGHDYAECYHFVNGVQHFHDVADSDNPNPTETVNGVEGVLKEDKQLIYREFNQLFTGYGWGVTSKGLTDYVGVENMDITHTDNEASVEKFESTVTELSNNKEYKLGDIFSFVDKGVELKPGALAVSVTNLDDNNPVSVVINYDRGIDDAWKNGTIKFTGTGKVKITIQDYYFCTPTEITVDVKNAADVTLVDRFAVVFPNPDDLNRVGNGNSVKLGQLFTAIDGIGNNVTVTFETVYGATVDKTTVSATKSNWAAQEVKFSGTGIIKVTISDDNFSKPLTQILEVVDATNVTGLGGELTGNVVLLNDCNLNSLTVSGRNTVFGNGFTATYSGDGRYLNNGLKQGVITVSENGTLDNLRVIAPIYPFMAFSYKNVQESAPKEIDGTKTRYYYQLSAVKASGNATISNCYIYGGRTNIFVDTGNVTVKDTVLECGVAANSQIISTSDYTVTFENVTTIQYLVKPTVGTDSEKANNNMLGFGILVGEPDTDYTPTNPKLVLKGFFKQYNWASQNEYDGTSHSYSGYAKQAIQAALSSTNYKRTINGSDYVNMGIVYLNDEDTTIINQTGLDYLDPSSITIGILTGKVYSLSKNASESQVYFDHAIADRSTVNGLYQPQFKYDSTLGGQHIAEGGDEHFYREGDTIKVMFVSGDTKNINLAALVNIAKYSGQNLSLVITCKDSQGNNVNVTNGQIALSTAGDYTVTYTVTDTLFYDKNGNTVEGTKTYSWNTTISVSLMDKSVPNAYYEFDSSKQVMGYSGYSGNYSQFIPFLAGLKIYDYNGQNAYLRFNGDTDYAKVAKIDLTASSTESNHYLITVTLTDGGVITLHTLARADSGGSKYTGSIKVRNNVIYYVNDGTTGASNTTWTIDYYKFIGNNGVEINSGAIKFTSASASKPSSSFNTKINYTVTYNANGGDCGQTLGYATSAATAVTLPTPSRSGYTFRGWYTAASGGTKIGDAGASYTPSANVTLYAQWGQPVTITFNANGGNCAVGSVTTGGNYKLPDATRDGYTFLGWYDAAEDGNRIGGAGYSYSPSEDVTLYAYWQIPIYVNYNANGGSCNTTSSLYKGEPINLPSATTTAIGYRFAGWYTAASGGTKIGDAGATYTPSANITLYAQWEKIPYTISVSTNGANVNGVSNGQIAYYGDKFTITVQFTGKDDYSLTIKDGDGNNLITPITSSGTHTVNFEMPASNVTISASSSCITPDTLITLADGSQVRVDSLKGDELLLVWNMETGKFDYAPIMFVDSEAEAEFEVIKLCFSDGTDVKVIYEHGFWDYDLNKYVYLDRYADKYIGHTFAKQNGDSLEKVQLTDVVIETEVTTAWSPVTVGHLCYFVNGMLSMPGGISGLFNIFEVDAETMTYDHEAIEKDIETYGLFTYEELNAICPLSEEMFNAAGGAYLKISIGKGNLTMDELINMINRYSVHFN